jgi:phosphatidylserine/phosphatidylglycerophosphate/cardiolipin synthase-like enzyme
MILSTIVTVFCLSSFALTSVPTAHVLQISSTPDSDVHGQLVQLIDRAQSSIQIWMYSWTDKTVSDALIRAHQRGVATQVIMDPANYHAGIAAPTGRLYDLPTSDGPYDATSASGVSGASKASSVVTDLSQAGVEIVAGTQAFSLTHAKTLIIDSKLAAIMTMNLTKIAGKVRDTAVFTDDPGIIYDLQNLFQADLQNSQNNGSLTPNFRSQSLVVSPTNSTSQIVSLIQSARREILITTENFGSDDVIQALTLALKSNVQVTIITPLCDMSSDHFYNIPHLQNFQSLGANVRVMSYPASPLLPYIHQKLIIVDRAIAYVGSENLTFNSLAKAREIGLVFNLPNQYLLQVFQADLQASEALPSQIPTTCSPL